MKKDSFLRGLSNLDKLPLLALLIIELGNEKLTKEHWTTHGNYSCRLCWFYLHGH